MSCNHRLHYVVMNSNIINADTYFYTFAIDVISGCVYALIFAIFVNYMIYYRLLLSSELLNSLPLMLNPKGR